MYLYYKGLVFGEMMLKERRMFSCQRDLPTRVVRCEDWEMGSTRFHCVQK